VNIDAVKIETPEKSAASHAHHAHKEKKQTA